MKKYLYYVISTLFLTGCINFNPNGNTADTSAADTSAVDTSVEVAEDSADELAMQNSPHLKFKNVPIDGTLDKFVARMVKSGFTKERKTTDQAILRGDFAGFKECIVYVATLTGKDLVSRITVSFPEREQWKNLYGDYKQLKELLITKYGKPSSCVEKFQGSYGSTPADDQDRMLYVHLDKCKYETRFVSDKGEIVLWIEHDGVTNTFVMLAYKDKINGSVIKSHAIDDL